MCWNIGSENDTCEHHAQPRFRPQCMHPDAGARLTCSVACLGRVESRLHAEMYGKALRRKAICGSDLSTALRSHRACCHRIALISSCPGIYACPYLRSNPGWLRGEGSGSRGSLGGLERLKGSPRAVVRLRRAASGLVCHVGKPKIDFLEIFSSRPGENAPGHQQMMRDASLGRGILIGAAGLNPRA